MFEEIVSFVSSIIIALIIAVLLITVTIGIIEYSFPMESKTFECKIKDKVYQNASRGVSWHFKYFCENGDYVKSEESFKIGEKFRYEKIVKSDRKFFIEIIN